MGMVPGLCNSPVKAHFKGGLGEEWGGNRLIVVSHHCHSSYLNIPHHDISFSVKAFLVQHKTHIDWMLFMSGLSFCDYDFLNIDF